MNTVIEQRILTQWRKLDSSSQKELIDFIEFLYYRQQTASKTLNKPFPVTHVEDGIGCVNYQGKRKSITEMQRGIMNEALRQWQQEKR